MAHVEDILISEYSRRDRTLSASIELKHMGKSRIYFTLPDSVYDLILNTAQYAADLHEQKIKAAIWAEKSEELKNDQTKHDAGCVPVR